MKLDALTYIHFSDAAMCSSLDESCRILQRAADIMDGGLASIALDHLEDAWPLMNERERMAHLRSYIDVEHLYADERVSA